jgi:hypothetical protein
MIPDPRMPGERPPVEVRELDGLLRGIRFEPRASLEPELLGRIRRGEQLPPGPSTPWRRRLWQGSLVLTGLAAAAWIAFFVPEGPVTIDRCCYDLDGGGVPDDGVQVVAQRDGRVYRLSIYEDRDRSGNHTTQDIIRLDRTGRPVLEEVTPAGLITIRHCCQDLDGGGTPDDGIVVSGQPPDRVVTAAIYELR